MDEKKLNEALEALKTSLEGKTEAEVKDAMEAFKVEQEKAFESLSTKEEVEKAQNEIKDGMAAIQDHLDKLDIRVQEKAKKEVNTGDIVKDLITDNFDTIKEVARKKAVTIESKAVGDMTLGTNFSGVAPRTQTGNVAIIPNQILNFSDLIGSINIGNGVYEFPRESAGEGSVSTQTEGSSKSQVDTDIANIPVLTDFIAGYTRYSKKMANNLPFLESFLPGSLRRKYFDAENSVFNTALVAAATASSQTTSTAGNKVEFLMNDTAALNALNYSADAYVISPASYWAIMQTEKSTGAGYGVPSVVTIGAGGELRIAGVPVYMANWLTDANKYFVGSWAEIKKIVTEGLSIQFSTEDGDNFTKNNISARVEAQVGLAIHRPDAIIYGDFTAV